MLSSQECDVYIARFPEGISISNIIAPADQNYFSSKLHSSLIQTQKGPFTANYHRTFLCSENNERI